jgi:hypothetical protein
MISLSLKNKIREKYQNKCANCGANGNEVPLEYSFQVARIHSEKIEEENIELLCHNCHAIKDRIQFKEIDLSNYLAKIIHKSPLFKDVFQDEKFTSGKNYRADIITKQVNQKGKESKVIIEIKSFSSFTRNNLIRTIEQLKEYRKYAGNIDLVFAFPGQLLKKEYELFKEEKIEVWDKEKIAKKFKNEIESTPHPIFQRLFTIEVSKTENEKLINKLESVKSGRKYWFEYQKLIGKILNLLFSGELSSPISELPDNFKINRRDFILPNYAENGFWAYLRLRYNADFIVVDAKNYSKKVRKKEVLQVANYLKKHGTGLLGIIISRNGGDRGCNLTIREIWVTEQKLIIVLTDDDIKKMLKANEPEEILKQRIEEFRLSI